MATRRSSRMTRAASDARDEVLKALKDDHKRVKKAYREFQKLDAESDLEQIEPIVRQVLDELTLHAQLEEELLYPAARGAVDEEDLIDEAEVEHESMKTLIEQLRAMDVEDEKFCARFTVLCEYTLHHVKEEEGEMFPELERARLDWEGIAAEMLERRAEQAGTPSAGEPEAALAEAGADEDEGQSDDAPPRSR